MAVTAAHIESERPPPPRKFAVRLYRGAKLRLPPRPDAPDPDDLLAVRRWVRAARRPTAIDLFCGAGGLSLGLQQSGFTMLVGADVDPTSVETHTANVGGLGYVGDLSDTDGFLDQLEKWGIRTVNLVAGGPPCQPFSRAGRSKMRSLVEAGQRSAQDPRAQMWQSFAQVVERMRPEAVLLENVPDLAAWDAGGVLMGLCESLRDVGYRADPRIVHAFEHGVPQHRSRLFVVALRPGRQMRWPKAQPNQPDVRAAIGDLPPVSPAQREECIPYDAPQSELQRRMRRGVPRAQAHLIHDHITRDVRPDDAEAFALLRPGQTYEHLPPHLRRYRSDIFSDKYKRLEWDGLSRSITAHIAKDGYWYIHPDQDRTLSIREAARIQTFPDWFRFAGQPSLRYRQIGNAVPPLLAAAIGRELRRALARPAARGRPRGSGRTFRDELLRWHAENARSFPWRRTSDPWHVLMAEMCLHRTRADQVAAVYRDLLRLAPSPEAMVERRAEVLQAIHSLGLRWRAENLVAVADVLVNRFEGLVPSTEVELLSLPGVGDYVAAAVLSFGFRRHAVLLDTNTERIVDRVRRRSLLRWQLRLDLYQLAGAEGPDAAFNYALLDLGALVCRAQEARCDVCPVRRHCESGRVGILSTKAPRERA
jgi:DNA (cytosine-5)-methyltransferase 1